MRFVFLGTGTSAGVPAIGCDCAVCKSPDPRDRRLRTSAAVILGSPPHHRVVLLDAGPDLRQQALAAGLDRCDAIFFTHNHVDHTFGLDEVRRFNAVQRAPVLIYGSDHTLDFLARVFQHIFDPKKNINDSFVATLITQRVRPMEPVDAFGLRVTPIPLLHGKLPVLGYRLDPAPSNGSPGGPASGATTSAWAGDRPAPTPVVSPVLPLAYCTDVSAVPPESWPLLEGLNTLVLDALRHRHHPTHLTLGQAVSIAQQVRPRHTYFVHMAHDLPHEETQASLPDGMFLAYDGLELR